MTTKNKIPKRLAVCGSCGAVEPVKVKLASIDCTKCGGACIVVDVESMPVVENTQGGRRER